MASIFIFYPVLCLTELLAATLNKLLILKFYEPDAFKLCPKVPSIYLPWVLTSHGYYPSRLTLVLCTFVTDLLVCPIIEEIYKLTELALNSGANGIVCSAQEIDLLRAKFGNGFLAVTPGIRPKWYTEGDDQVRICTPSEAFKKGASIIVIGRPVTKSPSPQFALQQIMEEIKNA